MTCYDDLWRALPLPILMTGPSDARIAAVNPSAETFLNRSERSLIGEDIGTCLGVETELAPTLDRVRSSLAPIFVSDLPVAPPRRPPLKCNVQLAPMGEAGAVLVMLTPFEFAGRSGVQHPGQSATKSAIGMAEMLAHEIKNPLAGITGAAQLLAMELSAEQRELTDLIVAEAHRVVKLLEQVEQVGNLRPARKAPLNLHDVLDRARRSAQVGFAAHMRFVEDYDPSLPMTGGDSDQLIQLLLNLIRNAAQAAPEGGTIKLRSFYDGQLRRRNADGEWATLPLNIEVIDDGPGLPADIADSVFEPFVSGRENGSGLGLALVSRIVADHDGWIAVDSVPGQTVFRVSFPIAPTTPTDPSQTKRG